MLNSSDISKAVVRMTFVGSNPTCPGVNRIEEDSVRFEHIRAGTTLDLREAFKCGIYAGHERRMLKPPDNVGVFFLGEITQVTLQLEIAERIERHGLTSRK
jgi:hypothetical protein